MVRKRWALTALGAWLWRWADDACTEILLNWPPASCLPNEAQLGKLRCWLNSVCEGLGPGPILGDAIHPKVVSAPDMSMPSAYPGMFSSSLESISGFLLAGHYISDCTGSP